VALNTFLTGIIIFSAGVSVTAVPFIIYIMVVRRYRSDLSGSSRHKNKKQIHDQADKIRDMSDNIIEMIKYFHSSGITVPKDDGNFTSDVFKAVCEKIADSSMFRLGFYQVANDGNSMLLVNTTVSNTKIDLVMDAIGGSGEITPIDIGKKGFLYRVVHHGSTEITTSGQLAQYHVHDPVMLEKVSQLMDLENEQSLLTPIKKFGRTVGVMHLSGKNLDRTHFPLAEIFASHISSLLELNSAREERTEYEDRFRLLFEHAPDACFIYDVHGNLLTINRATEKLTGYNEKELIGKSLITLTLVNDNDESGLLKMLSRNARGEVTGPNVINLNTKDGSEVTVEIMSHPVIMHGNLSVLGIARDISRRTIMTEAMHEAFETVKQANLAKSQFLAMVSHEIRTPMNAILGFTSMLREDEVDSEKLEKLEIILNSGKNLMSLINEILDFSKIESGKQDLIYDYFKIRIFIDEIIDLFKQQSKEKNITLKADIIEPLPDVIYCDKQRLHQVIVNIMGNAFKFTEKGSVNLKVMSNDGQLVFSIKDTGIGIADEDINKIFEPFQQLDSKASRRFHGSGLGLAICHSLIDKMRGSLSVISQQGFGSTFIVKIPLTAGNSASQQSIDGVSLTSKVSSITASIPAEYRDVKSFRRDINVLVAEDSETDMKLIKAYLDELTIDYKTVRNGQEALDLMSKEKFNLLLLDIEMPVMDGIELVSRIRVNTELKKTYVVAVTAHALKGYSDRYKQSGCDDVLIKPYTEQQLEDIINNFVMNTRFISSMKNGLSTPEIVSAKITELSLEDRRRLNDLVEDGLKQMTVFNQQVLLTLVTELREVTANSVVQEMINKVEKAILNFDDIKTREQFVKFQKFLDV
jgi:PAS domain S-box-containing protein